MLKTLQESTRTEDNHRQNVIHIIRKQTYKLPLMALKVINTVFHSQIMPNKEQCIAFLWDIQEKRIYMRQGPKGKILILTTCS